MENSTESVQLSLAEDTSSASPDFAEIGPGVDQQSAFRRLAAAALQAAIDDALGPDSQPAYSAVRWLAGDTTEGLTLEICCNLLGLDPVRIRARLSLNSEVLCGRLSRYRRVVAYASAATDSAPWLSNAHAGSQTR